MSAYVKVGELSVYKTKQALHLVHSIQDLNESYHDLDNAFLKFLFFYQKVFSFSIIEKNKQQID